MKPAPKKNIAHPGNAELDSAIALVWGSYTVRQFDTAYALARGCLHCWPNEPRLTLLAWMAAVEIDQPFSLPADFAPQDEAWRTLVSAAQARAAMSQSTEYAS